MQAHFATCTIGTLNPIDDGLLRISTGCAGPASSSILYVDCSNLTLSTRE